MVKKKAMCSLKTDVQGADIGMIKTEELHDFEEHPFKVERNQELFELRRSIQQEGILVPLLIRKNPDGEGFEIIAGHRRKEAALWAGIKEVPAIICTMDDDQAGLPGVIWYQHHWIEKLEKELEEIQHF